MQRLIIVGSPRTEGRSAHLANLLFETNIEEHPEDELFLVPLSEVEVGPCIGCGACREKSPVTFKDDSGAEVTEERYRCIYDDEMQTLYDLIDEVDEVSVVSPVYFSGAPSQLKCLLDRLQPYFWRRVELRDKGALPEKRPLKLHVVGEGGDPHGHAALVSEVRSAFAVADFKLESVLDWTGKISEDGEIEAEAQVEEFEAVPAVQKAPLGDKAGGSAAGKARPKLDLTASRAGSSGKAGDSSRGSGGQARNRGGKPSGQGGKNAKASGAGGSRAQGKKGAKGGQGQARSSSRKGGNRG